MTTTLAKPATPNQFGKRRIDAKFPGRQALSGFFVWSKSLILKEVVGASGF
jgi:hypothetical protein